MTVSVVRFDKSPDPLGEAIELCNGFEGLQPRARVLLKPNITFCWNMPPYGMVTTSRVLDGLVQLLLEHGCQDISIGEGTTDVFGSNTRKGYRWTGIDRLAKRYGVKLVDLSKGPFQETDLGEVKVRIARAAMDTDFLINVPVLKTHGHTKVSLGFKNLKGCLSRASKKRFHTCDRLNHMVYLLNEVVRSDLTIIDGIYMLERGPDTLLGMAHRKDLIIASRDIFACDVVGSAVLGIDPSQVAYLREYAENHNRSLDVSQIEVKGEDVENLRENLRWRADVNSELLAPRGITGLSVPYPGDTLCSHCYVMLASALLVFGKDNPNMDFGKAEVYCGKELKANQECDRVFLYGDCAIGNNRDLQNGYRIKGCPPRFMNTMFVLSKTLLKKPRMFRVMLWRTIKVAAIKAGLYTEPFSKWQRYRSKEFDISHFSA